MNPAYKHLSDRFRLGELTIPQIVGLFCGLMSGLVFALYLTPFGAYLTLFISIYLASIPAGAVLLAASTEFDAWLTLRAVAHELLSDGRYVPGPGASYEGYVICDAQSALPLGAGDRVALDSLEAIWDS